jgi:uncharacterized tellurite resistance protein B-like protein
MNDEQGEGPDILDLTAEMVYRILLEECMQDGKFSREEEQAILAMRHHLGISGEQHVQLLEETRAAVKAGEVAFGGEMDPVRLFERVYEAARSDGRMTDGEQHLLRKVADHFSITPEEFQQILARRQG